MESELAAVFLAMVFESFFEVIKQRFAAMGPLAVRPAIHLHLKEAQIESHLQLWLAIVAGDAANVDGAGLIFPTLENMADVFGRMPLAFSSAAARLRFF